MYKIEKIYKSIHKNSKCEPSLNSPFISKMRIRNFCSIRHVGSHAPADRWIEYIETVFKQHKKKQKKNILASFSVNIYVKKNDRINQRLEWFYGCAAEWERSESADIRIFLQCSLSNNGKIELRCRGNKGRYTWARSRTFVSYQIGALHRWVVQIIESSA